MWRKLNFIILADDGMIEARESNYSYTIFQLDNVCKATFYHDEKYHGDLLVGSLYECLDACNEHYENNYVSIGIDEFAERLTSLLQTKKTTSPEVQKLVKEVEDDPKKSRIAELCIELRGMVERSEDSRKKDKKVERKIRK